MWKIFNAYIADTITMIGVVIFGKVIIDDKIQLNKLKTFIWFEIICIMHIIAFMFFSDATKTLIMVLNNMMFYKYLYKISYSKSLMASFLCMLLFVIVDILEILIITNIFGMEKTQYYNYFAGSIIANIITVGLYTIIVIILKKSLRKVINTNINNNLKIIMIAFITLIPILLFFYTIVKEFKFSNNVIQYLIAIAVLIIILFSLIKQTLTNNKIKEEYDKLLEFMTTYENEIEKQRILRHETKNEFLAIRAKLCDNQKNKEIIGYIDEILKDKIKVKQEAYAKFGYLPANGIKGLCYFKTQVAEEKGIQVSLNISKKIKDSSIYKLSTKEQREFGRILGVILDNAIEASNNSEKKQIGIEAYTTSDKNCKIIISNTFDGEIDKNKIGKERFSTKGKNRGHGLLLVKHIINENKIFELNTTVQNNIYTQKISIKKSIE